MIIIVKSRKKQCNGNCSQATFELLVIISMTIAAQPHADTWRGPGSPNNNNENNNDNNNNNNDNNNDNDDDNDDNNDNNVDNEQIVSTITVSDNSDTSS